MGLQTQNAQGVSSFTVTDWGSNGCDATGAVRPGTADFNGDGKDDWYCMNESSGLLRVRLSTGTAFMGGSAGFDNFGPFCAIGHWTLADLNGDGRPDTYCPLNGKVAFNTGRSFLERIPTQWVGGIRDIFAADVDGDGAQEIVVHQSNSDIVVAKWNGTTLNPWETWSSGWCVDPSNGVANVTAGDFNGDGKLDVLCVPTQAVAVGGTTGVVADLLDQTGNGLGGTTTVQYTPSSAFPSDNNPPVRPVVTSATIDDGRGGASTSTFTYSGSRIDRIERQFLGFQWMRATAPCIDGESLCPYSETTFSRTWRPSVRRCRWTRRTDRGPSSAARRRRMPTATPCPGFPT